MENRLSSAKYLLKQKKYEELIDTILQALALDVKSIDALLLLSKCMLSMNIPEDACSCLKKVLAIDPENQEAKIALSQAFEAVVNINSSNGNLERVPLTNARKFQLFVFFGRLEWELNNKEKAAVYLKKAVKIVPKDSLAWHDLSVAFLAQKNPEDAQACALRAISLGRGSAEYYNQLGRILCFRGDVHSAINAYKQAINVDSSQIRSKKTLSDAFGAIVPAWHIPMMNDLERNNAYMNAINKAVNGRQVVLEIGTGSGLLSMMAVDAGAHKVITCEANQMIADVAKKIISQNGFSENINVINKMSTELVVGGDLPGKADLVISEILSSELVGEGVIPTMLDVNRRLLNENGKLIPESGEIRVALLKNSAKSNEDVIVRNIHEYNFSKYNQITQVKCINILKEEPCFGSSIEVAFSFNFYDSKTLIEQKKIMEIEAFETGIYIGLMTWLKLDLYGDIVFENKPSKLGSGWVNPMYRFECPLQVSKGDKIKLRATLKRDFVWFEFVEVIRDSSTHR